MYEFMTVLRMDFKNLYTNPMWWTGNIGLPLLLALVVGFITKGLYGTEIHSFDYYCVTMLIFGALNNSTIAANSFLEGRIVKANMRLIHAPIPDFYIYVSKAIASFFFGIICHTLTAGILFIITGADFGGSYACFLWLLLLAVELGSVCFGILLCCILKQEETVNMILSTGVMLFSVLGGAFFPAGGMGRILSAAGSFSPVSWISRAAFEAIYDGRLGLLWLVCAAAVLLSAVCLYLTSKLFHREDYL